MRAGNLSHTVKFYAKVITRDEFNASVDTYPIATITTRGEVRYSGGSRILSNEEKFYSKSMELTVRYNPDINETMRVQIDDLSDLYLITYMEIIGKYEGIRLSLEKLNDGLEGTVIQPPTNLQVTFDTDQFVLTWTNNANNEAVVIERSSNGNEWEQIHRTAVETETYEDADIEPEVKYYYRIRAFKYNFYSTYTDVVYIIWLLED